MTKQTKKCPVCGAGPMNYTTFQKHYYNRHYKPKKKGKKKESKRWKKPKLIKR